MTPEKLVTILHHHLPLEEEVGGLQLLPGGEAIRPVFVVGAAAQRSRADEVSAVEEEVQLRDGLLLGRSLVERQERLPGLPAPELVQSLQILLLLEELLIGLFGALGQLVGKDALKDLIREGQLLLVSAGHQRLERRVVSCVVGAMKRKFLDGMGLLV